MFLVYYPLCRILQFFPHFSTVSDCFTVFMKSSGGRGREEGERGYL